ncbi:MAG: peptidylprolyl isomerase [Acidobacteria bacterium]|nr:peptidylprolyl isomerase [Acidobacteriota bacterium]
MTFRAPLPTTVAVSVALALAAASGPTLEGQAARAKTSPELFNEQAPATFKANFDTSKGSFVVDVRRDWAPIGADRFYNLIKGGLYDGNRFFYVTDRVALFGINGEPTVAKAWLYAKIPNDKTRVQSNVKGTVALSQSNGRKTQTQISIEDNVSMDPQVTPFGTVSSGMNVIQRLYTGYGEMFPTGKAPTMTHMLQGGNAYLEKNYPMMDYIKAATIVP